MSSDPATISAYAGAVALVLHAIGSCAVQIIRAWKTPATIATPHNAVQVVHNRPVAAPPLVMPPPTPPKGPTP